MATYRAAIVGLTGIVTSDHRHAQIAVDGVEAGSRRSSA